MGEPKICTCTSINLGQKQSNSGILTIHFIFLLICLIVYYGSIYQYSTLKERKLVYQFWELKREDKQNKTKENCSSITKKKKKEKFEGEKNCPSIPKKGKWERGWKINK